VDSPGWQVREDGRGVVFDVLVQPRASRERIGPVLGGRLKVAVTAPPVDGRANAAVVETLARALGVRRAAVSIAGGEGSRKKTVRVEGVSAGAVRTLTADR
jgi:uncharacterized protein (TIGR00251 family)